jgi:hypothetical protein
VKHSCQHGADVDDRKSGWVLKTGGTPLLRQYDFFNKTIA